MKPISDVAKRIGEAAGSSLSSVSASRQPLERATGSEVTEAATDLLFDMLRGIFGAARFTREHGEYDRTGAWARAIHGLTAADLDRGYAHFTKVPTDWIPTPPQFRQACLPPQGQEAMATATCSPCQRVLPWPSHKQQGFTGDRIIGRTEAGAPICNVCDRRCPLPFSDVVRKLERQA